MDILLQNKRKYKHMISNTNVLSMREAAGYIGMEYETFRYYVTNHRGPEFIMKNKKTRLFTPEWLDEWIRSRKRKKRVAK